jgi:hypothetical protein
MTKEQFLTERIAQQKPKCLMCHGAGVVDHNLLSTDTIIKIACGQCADFEFRLDLFCRGFFNPKYVMPRYWDAVYLSNLKPSPESKLPLERQAKLLERVRNSPDQGFAIFGPPQFGKTHVTVGLYAKVLYNELMTADMKPSYRVPVRRLTSKTLLDQHQAYAMRSHFDEDDLVPTPDVTRESIIRCFENGSKYRLFLEEVDKIKETEARRATMFEILDTLHGCMGQFVMTSNLTPEVFAAQMGGDFMHRIKSTAEIIDLF